MHMLISGGGVTPDGQQWESVPHRRSACVSAS
ncbi:MAG: hypothetical protein GX575_33355 [Candidatus Anammoximicrobium sp.]|nr:hypothetical protein [Candidatus Anammoximicrobium sp.]